MALQRMDHVGIVVEDLDATIAFCVEFWRRRLAERRPWPT
jgi:catechol 2,3-dioxygenase-like lactoylglutathione lyase family enzyme